MDALITALAPAFGAEALKIWGAYAFVLIVLGWTLFRTEKRVKERETENAALRAELSNLQALRVEDAKRLIQIAETGNERMVSRYSGDQQQADSIASIAMALQDLRFQVRALAPEKARA